MNNRRSYLLIGATVFIVGVAMRTIPLYWSPLPFNTDGFHQAALARETLARGHLPVSQSYFNPDEYTFASLLAITSAITGISPLYIAQILIASIGAISCLIIVAITRRIGEQLRWSFYETRTATIVAGLVLATEGIFLGRSTAVSSEGVGLLFVILSMFVFAHTLWASRSSWLLLSGLLFLMLPLTHNLSTIIGALSAVSLLTLYLRKSATGTGLSAGILVVGLWVYAGVYYTVSELNEVSRISSVPGLFVAWIIVLILLTSWLSETQPRFQRVIPTMMMFGGGSLLLVNYFVPIFPGTATTEQLTLLFLLPIVVIAVIASWGIPYVIEARIEGYAIFALLLGPLSLIGFALTGGLTVAYQDLAVRGQIFVHPAFAILAGLSTVAMSRKEESFDLPTVFVFFVVACSVISAPLAFSGLHATSAQPLVTQTEFETANFASMYIDHWTSDGHMTRVASKYYPTKINGTQTGVYNWLHGNGAPPNCPVASQRSWTTVGAQLFPSSPERMNKASYNKFIHHRNLIYTTSGEDALILTVPLNGRNHMC